MTHRPTKTSRLMTGRTNTPDLTLTLCYHMIILFIMITCLLLYKHINTLPSVKSRSLPITLKDTMRQWPVLGHYFKEGLIHINIGRRSRLFLEIELEPALSEPYALTSFTQAVRK